MNRGRPEVVALSAWLKTAAATGDPRAALIASAEAIAFDPWDVVRVGGVLARARPTVAVRDLGLTSELLEVAVDSPAAVLRVETGAVYPASDRAARTTRRPIWRGARWPPRSARPNVRGTGSIQRAGAARFSSRSAKRE